MLPENRKLIALEYWYGRFTVVYSSITAYEKRALGLACDQKEGTNLVTEVERWKALLNTCI